MTGAFHIYRFLKRTEPDVVFLEHTISNVYLENHDQVERYNAAFESLRHAALTPRRSAAYVSMLVDDL